VGGGEFGGTQKFWGGRPQPQVGGIVGKVGLEGGNDESIGKVIGRGGDKKSKCVGGNVSVWAPRAGGESI